MSGDMAARGRIGALITNARYSGDEITSKARATFIQQFVHEARADALARGEILTDEEAARRGEFLRRAHYARMARRSALARSKRAQKAA